MIKTNKKTLIINFKYKMKNTTEKGFITKRRYYSGFSDAHDTDRRFAGKRKELLIITNT
jgi:hypothetical protein